MESKTVQQLKEEGFEFKLKEIITVDREPIPIDGEYIYAPTLSELIEACGEGTSGNSINLQYTRDMGCKASKYFRVDQSYVETKGQTLEEAVARLWLALKSVDNSCTKS